MHEFYIDKDMTMRNLQGQDMGGLHGPLYKDNNTITSLSKLINTLSIAYGGEEM